MSTAKDAPNGGRNARRRRPKPGDVASLRRVLWSAIRDVEAIIHDPPDGATLDQRLRAVQALATVSGVYLKAIEHHELTARVEAIEETQERLARTKGTVQGWHPAA